MGIIQNRSGKTYVGVGTTSVLDGSTNCNAVRIESQELFANGLFIMDFDHMPGRICGI